MSTGNAEYVRRVIEPLGIGRYPTPVFRAETLSGRTVALWVKNDGKSAELYGGNKVRKLELLLADARRKGARRIVTAGAAGSHHVLATSLYAKQIGLSTVAVLCPQPHNEHTESMLRAILASGVEYHVVGSMPEIPLGIARVIGKEDYFVLPGGTSRLSTHGYVNAMRELATQIDRGELPEPDEIVAAVGSGGTVAGILAGVVAADLQSRVVGVTIAAPAWIARRIVLTFARSALPRGARGGLGDRLEIEDSELGDGYGHPTAAGTRAESAAAGAGLSLDPTYTAKTFAHVLQRIERYRSAGTRKTILYLHTLSEAPLLPLLANAPALGPDGERLLPRLKS
jgi:1-aminocyclopropane-1-carboxylate deaminase/D-cysteine desulfhydrase-like pyridoxal-dependent ACC family enzyme